MTLQRCARRLSRPPTLRCLYSTNPQTPSAPPLLLKLRNDLKSAMKAKDTNRLNVLRGLLSDVTNASKTSSPLKTDMQMLSLLRKRAAASKAAANDFASADRLDLKEKEDAQVAVLEEYAGGVKTVSDEEVRAAVEKLRADMTTNGEKIEKGSFLRRLIGPGGVYDGKAIERATVVKIAQEVLGG